LRNLFLIVSLKRENLAQANFAEEFTVQVSPERDMAHLSELFVKKIGCSLEHFLSSEWLFAQASKAFSSSEGTFA